MSWKWVRTSVRTSACAAVVLLTLLASCGAESSDQDSSEDSMTTSLLYTVPPGDPGGTVTNLVATEGVVVRLLTRSGGEVTRADSTEDDQALRFPAHGPIDDAPRAVIQVHEEEGALTLTPREARFTFGADFRLDVTPKGVDPNDGDNLIQRGLAGQPSQLKIEIDSGRPGCRVRGTDGDVQVRVDLEVDSERWYRARCTRSHNQLSFTVTELNGDGTGRQHVAAVDGRTGYIAWSDPSPLSVGGKLRPDGEIVKVETDQFNGWIARPVLLIDRS